VAGFQSGGEKCRYLEGAVLPSAVLSKVYCTIKNLNGSCRDVLHGSSQLFLCRN
jgi:hypothetical protein